jgi:hypothetical protein
MAKPRFGLPYVWTTHVTGYLAGADSCEFKLWFPARFYFDKVDREFDLVAWTAEHGQMVRERAEHLRADGWSVLVEDQNKFTLKGKAAILAGKPDIVALRDGERLVVDCKTGKERDSDVWQVLLYQFALPLCGHRFTPAGTPIRGEVQYRHRSIHIAPSDFTLAMRDRIVDVLTRIGTREALPKTPSFRECAFCSIPKSECPERVETEPAVAETAAF